MNRYVDISSGLSADLAWIRLKHPNISIGRNPKNEALIALGFGVLKTTEMPTGDVVAEGAPEQREDGLWYQTWEVRDFTPEEQAKRIEQAKLDAISRINAEYQAELSHILAEYPDAETKTWDKQDAEARAWSADNSADTPLIDAIAAARGIDKAALVAKIITKSEAWVAASGHATGKRQALEEQVLSASTTAEVNAVVW